MSAAAAVKSPRVETAEWWQGCRLAAVSLYLASTQSQTAAVCVCETVTADHSSAFCSGLLLLAEDIGIGRISDFSLIL